MQRVSLARHIHFETANNYCWEGVCHRRRLYGDILASPDVSLEQIPLPHQSRTATGKLDNLIKLAARDLVMGRKEQHLGGGIYTLKRPTIIAGREFVTGDDCMVIYWRSAAVAGCLS